MGLFCDAQVMRVAEMIVHPQWTGETRDGYDIALGRLSEPVVNVSHPLLPDKKQIFEANTVVRALGYGKPKTDFLRIAEDLLIVQNKYCPGQMGWDVAGKDSMMCTVSKRNQTPLRGKWQKRACVKAYIRTPWLRP